MTVLPYQLLGCGLFVAVGIVGGGQDSPSADPKPPVWWRNLTISVAAVLAVLGLSLWVSHHTSTGLGRIRAGAQRIAEGDLSPPARAQAPKPPGLSPYRSKTVRILCR